MISWNFCEMPLLVFEMEFFEIRQTGENKGNWGTKAKIWPNSKILKLQQLGWVLIVNQWGWEAEINSLTDNSVLLHFAFKILELAI